VTFTIVIPAYNEAASIAGVLTALRSFLQENDITAEIIVVDDGSTDGTRTSASAVPGVRVMAHRRNKGYGAALKTGITAASTEWVLTYDADSQHTPDLISALLPALHEENDLIIGKREGYQGPFLRQPGKRLIGAVAEYLTETKIADLNSGFRAFRRERILPYLHLFPDGFSFSTTSTVCFLKEGLNVDYVPIRIRARIGRSTVRPSDAGKTFMLILRLIMLFSPLRIFLPATGVLAVITATILGYELAVHRNVSDAAVALLALTCMLFFFGLLADQVAALRRAIGKRSV
jgi:glycosyltransferase involved in cell wall biosynthesis